MNKFEIKLPKNTIGTSIKEIIDGRTIITTTDLAFLSCNVCLGFEKINLPTVFKNIEKID